MTKLRHVNARTLKEVEALVEAIDSNIIILGVNNVGGSWFCHFLVHGQPTKELKVGPTEIVGSTKVKRGK
jgi:hypothetical protein